MNSSIQKPLVDGSGMGEFEETLRLIASLSVPEGLEERVQAGLHAETSTVSRRARILRWPVMHGCRTSRARQRRRRLLLWWSAAGGEFPRAFSRLSHPVQLRFLRAAPDKMDILDKAASPAPEPCALRKRSTGQSSNIRWWRIRQRLRRRPPSLPQRRQLGTLSLRRQRRSLLSL
jgi:hypothetical protein